MPPGAFFVPRRLCYTEPMRTSRILAWVAVAAALWGLCLCLARPIADLAAFPRPAVGPDYPPTEAVPLPDGDVGRLRVVRNPASAWSVLYFHGNGEDLAEVEGIMRGLARHATVYAADYRGYGRSTGRPSVRTFEADARAFHDAAVALGADPARLIVHGYSLGTAAAAEVAFARPVAGLLLGGAFTSVLAVPRLGWLLPFDWLRTEAKLPRVACPIRLYHGTADRLIPFAHAERLKAAAPRATLVPLPGEDHIGAHRHDAEQLRLFIEALTPGVGR